MTNTGIACAANTAAAAPIVLLVVAGLVIRVTPRDPQKMGSMAIVLLPSSSSSSIVAERSRASGVTKITSARRASVCRLPVGNSATTECGGAPGPSFGHQQVTFMEGAPGEAT